MIWGIIVFHVAGGIATVLMDAYFKWKLDSSSTDTPPLFVCAIFWPVFFIIGGLVLLHGHVEVLGERHRDKREKSKMIRILEQNQVKKQLEESEREIEMYMEQLNQKRL